MLSADIWCAVVTIFFNDVNHIKTNRKNLCASNLLFWYWSYFDHLSFSTSFQQLASWVKFCIASRLDRSTGTSLFVKKHRFAKLWMTVFAIFSFVRRAHVYAKRERNQTIPSFNWSSALYPQFHVLLILFRMGIPKWGRLVRMHMRMFPTSPTGKFRRSTAWSNFSIKTFPPVDLHWALLNMMVKALWFDGLW